MPCTTDVACTVVKLCNFGCVCVRGELGFLNCDDICMFVVNESSVMSSCEFVFDSVYADL